MRDFVEPWKRVSEALSQKVTDKKYVDLSRDEKMDFTKLLFIASITETTAKNALDMLRTGHRAMILMALRARVKRTPRRKLYNNCWNV